MILIPGTHISEAWGTVSWLDHIVSSSDFHDNITSIAMIYVTKSRTGNYDFRACARARGFPGSTLFGGHIRFAVCAERSRDNNLRFLRKCHPDKIWNILTRSLIYTGNSNSI